MKGEVVWKFKAEKNDYEMGQFLKCGDDTLICIVRTSVDDLFLIQFPEGNHWIGQSFSTGKEAVKWLKECGEFDSITPVTINFVEV